MARFAQHSCSHPVMCSQAGRTSHFGSYRLSIRDRCYFVWTVAIGGPLFLVAGGSGIAPLMSMLRYRAAVNSTIPALLLYSSRAFEDIIYREELGQMMRATTGLRSFIR